MYQQIMYHVELESIGLIFFVRVRQETSAASTCSPTFSKRNRLWSECTSRLDCGLCRAKTGPTVLEIMCHFQADQVTISALTYVIKI